MSSSLRLAGLLCVAALLYAQDWKTAESLSQVDFTGLTAAQKATALRVLRDSGCSCGCSLKIAECRVVDPKCGYSTNLAKIVVDAVRQGKSEAETRAILDASTWSHPREPKLLEDPVQIPLSGAPSVGPAAAPITLVEFSDFQCPYCAAAVPQIRAVLSAYPTQIKLVFKEFPLEMHPQADLAASAALAAQKQGKFWAMHDALYGSQRDLSRSAIFAMAEKAGLDMKRFEADLESAEVHETILRDVQDGDRAGVQGTPTLFINGQRYNGPLSLNVMKPLLDDELKRASGPASN